MVRSRRTLTAATATLAGTGLHSGKEVSVRVLPADSGVGVWFRDLDSGQEIAALAANVVDTSRCTVLGAGGVNVQTVEHLLSALAGTGVDDALIESWGGELPALDGSAAPFVSAIEKAGVRDQGGTAIPLQLDRPLLLLGEKGSSLLALPSPVFEATVVLDYPKHAWLGTQAAEIAPGRGDYASEIAPARTYGFLSEIAWLQAHGLALGASYDNGVALREDGYDVPLRFDNELARHKLLDLIGDLSLAGRPCAMRIIAVKPSHTLNCRFARLLADVAGAGVN